MNQEKYIGLDVHAATISAAVKNAEGKSAEKYSCSASPLKC
jgi:hypothetical protein